MSTPCAATKGRVFTQIQTQTEKILSRAQPSP